MRVYLCGCVWFFLGLNVAVNALGHTSCGSSSTAYTCYMEHSIKINGHTIDFVLFAAILYVAIVPCHSSLAMPPTREATNAKLNTSLLSSTPGHFGWMDSFFFVRFIFFALHFVFMMLCSACKQFNWWFYYLGKLFIGRDSWGDVEWIAISSKEWNDWLENWNSFSRVVAAVTAQSKSHSVSNGNHWNYIIGKNSIPLCSLFAEAKSL